MAERKYKPVDNKALAALKETQDELSQRTADLRRSEGKVHNLTAELARADAQVDELKKQVTEKGQRRRPPVDRAGLTHKFAIYSSVTDGQKTTAKTYKGYVTVGCYEDGEPCEIFVKLDKQGSDVSVLLDSWAIAVSMLLQTGTPLKTVVDKFKGMRSAIGGRTDTPGLRTALSPIDYVVRYLERRYLDKKPLTDE